MTAPASKSDLGYLIRHHQCRCTPDSRGKLFYLPATRAIVVPERRQGDQWQCLVLASATESARRIAVALSEIDTALTVLSCDPDTDPDTYALLWQARVWQRW